MSKFELNAAGIAEVLYLNPKIAAETNKVGKAAVASAKSLVQAGGTKETQAVAKAIVLRPAEVKRSTWLANQVKSSLGKPVGGEFYVAVVASNHPTTQFWEWGSSKRKATYFMRSALAATAAQFPYVRKGKQPPKGTGFAPKGKKR
jgi:hypothetical protein